MTTNCPDMTMNCPDMTMNCEETRTSGSGEAPPRSPHRVGRSVTLGLVAVAVAGASFGLAAGLTGAAPSPDPDSSTATTAVDPVAGREPTGEGACRHDGVERAGVAHARRVGRGMRPGFDGEVVAAILGIEVHDLRSSLRDGSSIADIAGEVGVDVQRVIDALVAEMAAHLDLAVEHGRLTADEAATRRSEITERITVMVDRSRPGGSR